MTADPAALHHLAIESEWQDAVLRGGPYERSTIGAGLDQVGYIHCSFDHQVAATYERFYEGRGDVVLLRIDPVRLESTVVVEDLAGTGEEFPHVYGPLPLDAVLHAGPYPG